MTRQRSSKSQNIFEWPPSRTVKNMPSKGLTAPRNATALQRTRLSISVSVKRHAQQLPTVSNEPISSRLPNR